MRSPLESLASSGFVRIADARASEGNRITLLRDAPIAYPRWLEAIRTAERTVHLENYILEEDRVGAEFAEALIDAVGRGVRCRVIYDWLGCRRRTSRPFWKWLRREGVEVRCYNPPALWHPLEWISRDHRKVLCVDGRIGFTGGLCIGHDWIGDPNRGIPPWRDTAIEINGPAVADLDRHFIDSWNHAGPQDHRFEPMEPDPPHPDGLKAWVIAGVPDSMGLYRLEQLVADIAERSLWLTDAYFAATTGYVHALCSAARSGVDVRLLVPGASNFPVVRAISLAEYRPLLEAGVRVFEWDGPMLHAKTAVSDGCWSRVGSSNSNLASWISNRELDVTIHDVGFARQMEEMFEQDLENATEIVLSANRIRTVPTDKTELPEDRNAKRGRLLAGTVGMGSSLGATLTRHRALGPAEAGILVAGGAALVLLALVALLLPAVLAYPIGLAGGWIGIVLLVRAWKVRKGHATRQPPRTPAR